METKILFLSAALLAASCTGLQDGAVSKLEVRLELAEEPGLRAAASDAEKALVSRTVFIFDESGSLLGKLEGSGATLSTEVGKGTVCHLAALANCPSIAESIGSEQAFRDATVPFEANSPGNMVMRTPSVTSVEMSSDKSVTLTLERLASKVVISGGISFDFGINSPYRTTQNEIRSVFLMSVPAAQALVNTIAEPALCNGGGVSIDADGHVSGVPALCLLNCHAGTTSLDSPLNFYCYPNPSPEASSEGGADSVTKVIVCASLGGTLHYYPIGLGNAGSDRYYDIPRIIIDRPGASTPGSYALSAD